MESRNELDRQFSTQNGTCINSPDSQDIYDFIIESWQTIEELAPQYPEGCVEEYSAKYAFLHVPKERVNRIDEYGYAAIPKLFGLMETSSMQEIGALKVHNQSVLNLRGQGVIIGLIDTGIAYDLTIFRNEDGSSRIIGLWDQNLPYVKERGNGRPPFPFSYGRAYVKEEINQALRSQDPYEIIPSRDELGHGTFLAGIAAGRKDEENDFIGAAPDASIAMVKLRPAKDYLREFHFIKEGVPAYSEIDIMNAARYLLSLGRYYHQPVILCIGLGTNQGGHDGRMPLSEHLSDISRAPSVAVVQAAGNEGNARRHYYGKASNDYMDTVEIKTGANIKGFMVELWGSSLTNFNIGLQSPSGDRIEPVSYRTNEVRRYPFLLDGSTVYVYDRIAKMQEGDYVVLLRFETPSEGVWKIFVTSSSGDFRTDYHMWMPISQFVQEDTYFLSSNPFTTLVSNACASNVIVAGMYNHYQDSITAESSKGFTRINQVKPDFLAPGVNVYGPNTHGGYTRRTGSSVAAAHAAGAAALVMEYGSVRGNYSYMDGSDIKELLNRSASRKPDLLYPNENYGYGTLDVYQVFRNAFL